jgi:hypothetical protein
MSCRCATLTAAGERVAQRSVGRVSLSPRSCKRLGKPNSIMGNNKFCEILKGE